MDVRIDMSEGRDPAIGTRARIFTVFHDLEKPSNVLIPPKQLCCSITESF